ncbi:P-loop containing nucleoside triphosphate hydrolase protein, partial [Mycena epipterygia]
IDRRGAKRTVPMRVLVLGYPRTGTASMRAALEILGYNDVHHMHSVYSNPLEAPMWTEAINARFLDQGKPYEKDEWDQLLGHCQATTDTLAAIFAEDLITAYPDAKVILTNRDVDKWWISFTESIRKLGTNYAYRLAAALDPQNLGRVAKMGQLSISVLLGPVITEDSAKARFTAHYDNVRTLIPKERLLEYKVQEGWGPLCAFLGREIPGVEFPRTNDTKMFLASFEATTSGILRRFLVKRIIPCILLTGVVFAIYVKCSGRR